jgi:hypothetical protein
MDIRKQGLLGASVLLAIVLWCAWLWQPERQVRLHQRNLLEAIEGRNWDRAAEFLDDNYSDRWGHDKGFVLREAREAFRQFIAVEVTGEVVDLSMDARSGTVLVRLSMRGRGGPVAEWVMARVNALHEPWRFQWQQGNRPWKWTLVRVEHTELQFSGGSF